VSKVFSGLILFALVIYQRIGSPFFVALGARCRFHPTCSQYAVESVRLFGPWRGSWRALKRLGKCHPFHPGGYDPVAGLTAAPNGTPATIENIHG
jgi:putative membrane protein insertion efficiency factor